MDHYSRLHGFAPAVVTGKPVELHGSEGREAATGYGVICVAESFLRDAGDSLKGARSRSKVSATSAYSLHFLPTSAGRKSLRSATCPAALPIGMV